MKKIRFVATDIDDTILPYGKYELSDNIKKMFIKLRDKKIVTSLVTGRDFVTIGQMIKTENVDYFIGANGAFIYDMKLKKMIYEKFINHSDLQKIIDFFEQKRTKYVVMDDNFIYHPQYDSKHQGFLRNYQDRMKLISEYTFSSNVHIFTVIDDFAEKSPLQFEFEEFIKNNNLDVHVSSRWSWGFFVAPKNVNKFVTLKYLASQKGISTEEIIAFGDSRNDVEMIANVGLGVAMDNAIEELKAVAKDIALDVNEDGVYYKLVDLKIIEDD
ncbi:COF family HAD hydrolase protein [Mesomycoplasma conjunctivae]|uniref:HYPOTHETICAL Phosphatase yidA n=1 Tax=Mesomycoplasma conjunctivae (strain ATCC 25834 / NCTC 10147 / HRC/581) TaxID=572263 RepID=C5J6V4_MESCH|nr:Cof-type HAD-IIB family hydrolase [Mesomycoplasma conjunctivae]CAT05217.1 HYPOTHETICAL Phosphatase yidA [Mesomycoplasma conjunctivae]VEU66431.1 COF family HAD hydrolase protein [Mesomycoplasma conjunctivae]